MLDREKLLATESFQEKKLPNRVEWSQERAKAQSNRMKTYQQKDERREKKSEC